MTSEAQTLKVVLWKNPPWIDFYKTALNNTYSVSGILATLFKKATEVKGIQFDYFESLDGSWETPSRNGNFSGIIGLVQRNDYDTAGGPFFVNFERFQAVKFSRLLDVAHIAILSGYRQDDTHNTLVNFQFLRTFQSTVWICMALSFVACMCLLSFEGMLTEFGESPSSFNYTKLLMELWGGFLGQALTYSPAKARWSLRLKILSTWLIVSTFLMRWCFSGEVLSTLTVRKPAQQLTSFEDFQKLPGVIPIVRKGSAIEDMLQKSIFEDVRYIWEKIIDKSKPGVLSSADFESSVTIENVQSGKWAIVMGIPSLINMIKNRNSTLNCRFLLSQVPIYFFSSLVFGNNVSEELLDEINSSIDRMFAGGIVQRDILLWRFDIEKYLVGQLELTPQTTVYPLRGSNLGGIYLLFCTGLAVSSIVFVLEKLYCRV